MFLSPRRYVKASEDYATSESYVLLQDDGERSIIMATGSTSEINAEAAMEHFAAAVADARIFTTEISQVRACVCVCVCVRVRVYERERERESCFRVLSHFTASADGVDLRTSSQLCPHVLNTGAVVRSVGAAYHGSLQWCVVSAGCGRAAISGDQ